MNVEDCIIAENFSNQKISVLSPTTLNEIVHQRRPTLFQIQTIDAKELNESNESSKEIINLNNSKINGANESRAMKKMEFHQSNQN